MDCCGAESEDPTPLLHCDPAGSDLYNSAAHPSETVTVFPLIKWIMYLEDCFKISHSTMLIGFNIISLKMIQMISASRCHSFKPKFPVSPAARLRYATTASGFDKNGL